MPKAWTAKDERQYKHVKSSELKSGRSERKATQIAAATVNKQRAACRPKSWFARSTFSRRRGEWADSTRGGTGTLASRFTLFMHPGSRSLALQIPGQRAKPHRQFNLRSAEE